MKKGILLLACSALLSANYAEMEKYYQNGEYAKVIEEAKKSTTEYANPKLHLLWAKSAEELGETKLAMAAYERAVMLDEENIDAKLALLKIYNKQELHELAKELEKDLQNYQLTPAQRNSLALLRKSDVGSVKSQASIGIGYDSNINVGANDLYIPSTAAVETLFAKVNGSVSYIHELGEEGGFYARGDLRLFYQNNFDAIDYNMFVGGGELGVGYATSLFTLYVPVAYNRMNYLDVSLYAESAVTPYVNINLADSFIVNLNAKYADRNYIDQKYKNMSDTSMGAGAGLYYLFGKNYLYGTYNYEYFEGDETIVPFLNKEAFTGVLGVNYNFGSWVTTKVDYKYRYTFYHDFIPQGSGVLESREDNYHQFNVKLSHYFKKHYEVFLSGSMIENFSNYYLVQYNKNIVTAGLSFNY